MGHLKKSKKAFKTALRGGPLAQRLALPFDGGAPVLGSLLGALGLNIINRGGVLRLADDRLTVLAGAADKGAEIQG